MAASHRYAIQLYRGEMTAGNAAVFDVLMIVAIVLAVLGPVASAGVCRWI